MKFKIKATYNNDVVFFWWDNQLRCDNAEALQHFKEVVKWHIPDVEIAAGNVRESGYNADINDDFEMYYGILAEFAGAEVVIDPSDEFFGYIDGVIF